MFGQLAGLIERSINGPTTVLTPVRPRVDLWMAGAPAVALCWAGDMRINAFHRDEYLLVALNRVIATHGVVGLTVRRVADDLNMASSTLLHHYGSRARFMEVGAREMRRARRDWLASRVLLHGPVGFLPTDDDGVVAVRAWTGWLELWRSEAALGPIIREAREDELMLLAECVAHRLEREDLRHLQALIDGLYAAIAEPERPMRPRTALAVLTAHVRRLGVSDPDWLGVA